jgi:hypothetical protein
MSQNFVARQLKHMLFVQDDKSDRAAIVMELSFCVCFAFLALFMLQSESLRLTANSYLIPIAVGTLVISAGLVLSVLFRLRRLHVVAGSAV